MSEQEQFEVWWNNKGTNNVLLKSAAWVAWKARAELKDPDPVEYPDKSQPAKTRVRLWMRNDPWERPSVFVSDKNPYPGSSKYVEIHCDAEGFYVEKTNG